MIFKESKVDSRDFQKVRKVEKNTVTVRSKVSNNNIKRKKNRSKRTRITTTRTTKATTKTTTTTKN